MRSAVRIRLAPPFRKFLYVGISPSYPLRGAPRGGLAQRGGLSGLASTPPRAAARAAAPKRRTRPPKAIAQTANQAQPSARPASTSVSQWTSSNTRLAATATAMPTAKPASAGQARGPHQRPATSAKAAHEAAAVEV